MHKYLNEVIYDLAIVHITMLENPERSHLS